MMPLVHGAEISAAEIEAEAARWRQTFPAFIERVNVADNGIDAEWERDLTQEDVTTALEPLLRPGFNVFQDKRSRQPLLASSSKSADGHGLGVR